MLDARRSPRPSEIHAIGLIVGVWVLVVLPAALITAAMVALLIASYPQYSAMHVFLLVVVGVLWARVVAAVTVGRTGQTPAALRRFDVAVASGTNGAYDVTDELDHYAQIVASGPPIDLRRALPTVAALVDEVAGRVGTRPPEELRVVRGGWTVATGNRGRHVAIGTAFLMVAPTEVLRAELASALAPDARQAGLRVLRWARIAATGGGWTLPGEASSLDVLFGPARYAAARLELVGERLAARMRADAADVATQVGGVGAADQAAKLRGLIAGLWRLHLRELQRGWTASGRAVAPHESWPDCWEQAAAAGTSVSPHPHDVADRVTATGWPAPLPTALLVPRMPGPAALDALVGNDHPAVVRMLDDESAAQYYEDALNDRFGERLRDADQPAPAGPPAGPSAEPSAELPPQRGASASMPPPSPRGARVLEPVAVLTDPVADPLLPAGLPLEPDRRDPMPHVALILRQLDALEVALVRRDDQALAVARAIGAASEAPTVRCMAAGVRWLSGDPDGLAAIDQALALAPRGAGALADLVPALHAAEAHDRAQAIQAGVDRLARAVHARAGLDRTIRRAPKLVPTAVPLVVREALREIGAGYRGVKRVYFAEVELTDLELRPAALVRQSRFVTGRPLGGASVRRTADVVGAIWPATRVLACSDLAARSRWRLRRAVEPLVEH